MADELKLAVDLMKDSAAIVQSWIMRFFAVNAALVSAIGVIVGLDRAETYGSLVLVPIAGICVIGILASYFIGKVALRQIAWNWSFVERVKGLQPIERPILLGPGPENGGTVPKLVENMMWLAICLWAAALIWMLLATYPFWLTSLCSTFCAAAGR